MFNPPSAIHDVPDDSIADRAMTSPYKCLAGTRILDFTQVQFGPCATQVLADFGAEIVKIERPGVGDISRGLDPISVSLEDSTYFLACNRGKKSVVMDVRTVEGLADIRRLADTADVVVHNFRPGVMERLGLGYADLIESKPDMIYASGSGFGLTGPLSHKPGQDLVAQSLSGAAYVNRAPDGTPRLYPIAVGDFISGMMLVQAILLALRHRDLTGKGSDLSVNLLDAMMTLQQTEITQRMLRGRTVNYLDNELINVFRCRDGAVSLIGVFRPNPLSLVCEALGIDDLTLEPRFRDKAAQKENREALWLTLGGVFAGLDVKEAIARLESKDILCAPVLDVGQAAAQPQAEVNGMIIELDHPAGGRFRTVGNPIKFEGAADRHAVSGPPRLGQHTAAVLDALRAGGK